MLLKKSSLLFSALLLSACSNQPMLTIADFNSKDFQPTTKKSYQIEGKTVSKANTVHNILEGTNYIAQVKSDVVLKGTVGELWVAPLHKVLKTYRKPNGEVLKASDFITDQFVPLQTQIGKLAFALFVPHHQQVEVITAWGDKLIANRPGVEHGKGDYLVCSADEKGKPNLKDMWVVNGNIFPNTYDMQHLKK